MGKTEEENKVASLFSRGLVYAVEETSTKYRQAMPADAYDRKSWSS